MKILKKLPLLLVLCLALFASSSLVADAATNYCSGATDQNTKSDDGKVIVYNGDSAQGACHVQKLHMAAPGAGSAMVGTERKSQFAYAFDRKGMANVASIVIKNSTAIKKDGSKYVNEAYVATLNQDVLVVWTYYNSLKRVITMYPTKSYSSNGPIILPTKFDPIYELELESEYEELKIEPETELESAELEIQ